MHEAALTQGLVKILLSRTSELGVGSVSRVTLKVGRLKAVEPHSLRFCFEMFVRDTVLEGAELVIDTVEARATCLECSESFEVRRFCFRCPGCDSTSLQLTQGEELFIESFEI
ncbi:hydrogenase maturation nickel metallochaperone HypA [Ferrimonas sp.]|uniref:hydrogenase maturation nickel metallochaperone HypA n=1 Tax=Ferrimonas sp. TaxID=2080861 RepID=UPI003A8EBF53